ncbi:hypothetical protein EDB80DRAFT_735263 [Ilyonectria destructans]|nr:hypothetical protein EDB80DRAFT_742606 [Ilyonectria destructans]KAH6974826.1 hypothetical protein EDB80DRAFT_627310 [Ilyonectria destructans]KAH6983751.1 hypothetical protein EDB80DRAFT_735263 [Ilyonectria destructans]
MSPPINSATAKQPSNKAALTSWALTKAQLLRPAKVIRCQEQATESRLLQLNTRARQGRSSSTGLDLTRTQNIDALLIYIYGTLRTPSCMQCARGNGIFEGCITKSDIAAGACANCTYSSRGIRCSYHDRPKETQLSRSIIEKIVKESTPDQLRAFGADLIERAKIQEELSSTQPEE